MEKKEMKIETWYYLTFDTKYEDKGDYIIVSDQYKSPRYLIDKSVRKEFKSKEEKLKYRRELFYSIKDHPWYGRWFATETRKGKIFGAMYDFIDEFIEKTIDLDQGGIFVAGRNCDINGSMEHINSKNRGYLFELMMVFQSKVRIEEEGIVDIPFSWTEDRYLDLLKRSK